MTGTGVKQLPDTQVNFSPHLKVKLKFTLVLLNPFLKTLISWFLLEATESTLFSTLIENTDLI